jgi:hypothetical protein
MKFIIYTLISFLSFAEVSYAATKQLSGPQVNILNWLVECPNEVAEILQDANWVGGGTTWENSNNRGAEIQFQKRGSMGRPNEYISTLRVVRINRAVTPRGARPFLVECSIVETPNRQ